MKSKFYRAFWYLDRQGLLEALDVYVVKVNPETRAIDDETDLNTMEQVWLEFGRIEIDTVFKTKIATHYWELDSGGNTFEDAIIAGARKAKRYFKRNPEEKR